MNKHTTIHRTLAIALSFCLILPGAAFGVGSSGKKNFKEGMKYERLEQWDRAAQEFALAVAAEPNNPEYRLHLLRALQSASLMFLKRGDAFYEQNDYASAYSAYKQAFAYDQTNEMARVKMERMIELQKAAAGIGEPASYNKIGNYVPTADEVRPIQKRNPKDIVTSVEFKEGSSLKMAITSLARQLGLNVVFDETFKDNTRFGLSLQNVTLAKALDIILIQNKLAFEQLDRRTILIYQDSQPNRQRMERLSVKTFYLNNADPGEARALIQSMIGGTRPIVHSKQLNALVVRATPQELEVVQELLRNIDKNRPEVVIDVEIYEVSHSTSLELGNQLALTPQEVRETRFDAEGKPVTVTTGRSASLSSLGGIGQVNSIVGSIASPFLGGVGTLFGLPPSSLSLLQSKGDSKLLHKTQIHALDGEQNETVVGRSVPVRIGSTFPFSYPATTVPVQPGGVQGAIQGGIQGALTGGITGFSPFGGIDQIQYRDVGLVISLTPKITNEGYVEIKMKLETSNVEASGTDSINLTPSFTKRSLTTIARMQDGKTAIVAGVSQENKDSSRAGIPVLSMIPFLGRFMSTPRETSSMSDIIITITPHVIRSPELKKENHLAVQGGPMQGGFPQTIEALLERAQYEDDEDRRVIARQMQRANQNVLLQPAAQISETTAPALSSAPTTEDSATVVPTLTQPASSQAALTDPTPPPAPATSPSTVPAPVSAFQPAGVIIDPSARSIIRNTSLTETTQKGATSANTQNPAPPTPAKPVGTKSIAEATEPENASEKQGEEQAKQKSEPEPEVDHSVDPELYITKPDQPVKPAQVTTAKVPDQVEKARKEAEQKAKQNPVPKPAETPFVPPPLERPKQPVAPASIRPLQMAKPKSNDKPGEKSEEKKEAKPGSTPDSKDSTPSGAESAGAQGEGAIGLKLMPSAIKKQVGESFIVVLSVEGEQEMASASVGLKFDPAMLQVKAVRDGGLLGNHPDITQRIEAGNLVVTMQKTQEKATPANGRLLVVEFKALAAGETAINIDQSETTFTLTNKLNVPVTAQAAQVQISREIASNASGGR